MLAISCICFIFIGLMVGGHLLRKNQTVANITCFSMLIMMTASVVIGMATAIALPNMVLATIVAILLSGVACALLTFRLNVRIVFESVSALLMGAMMGVMFQLMVSSYTALGFVFFIALFIGSMIALCAWLAHAQQVSWHQLFSKRMTVTAVVSTIVLAFIVAAMPLIQEGQTTPKMEHHMHHE